jgi:hypothetical protein
MQREILSLTQKKSGKNASKIVTHVLKKHHAQNGSNDTEV